MGIDEIIKAYREEILRIAAQYESLLQQYLRHYFVGWIERSKTQRICWVSCLKRHVLQVGGTSYKSGNPPNGVPWKPDDSRLRIKAFFNLARVLYKH